jgi:hypothetical protein
MKHHSKDPRPSSDARMGLNCLRVFFLFIVIQIIVQSFADASVNLPIQNRMQWLENDGYCGEVSMQEVGLYYGTYASAYYIRNIFDSTQKKDLAELENWAKVLEKFKFDATLFEFDKFKTPQYKEFSGWLKKNLKQGHPVILATWIAFAKKDPSGNYASMDYLSDKSTSNIPYPIPVDPDPIAQIDHFITATGYLGADDERYNPSDSLIITNHVFSTYNWVQRFDLLFDTRENKGNSKNYVITLPQTYCFGLAITGYIDETNKTCPARIELDRIDEPNLIKKEAPVNFNATLTVENLKKNQTYIIYRYNDPQKIPSKNYTNSSFSNKVVFKATASTQTFSESIRSDGFAAFRCVPEGL